MDNVTVRSHSAGDTRNAYREAPLLVGKKIAKLLRGEVPDFIVNNKVLRKQRTFSHHLLWKSSGDVCALLFTETHR